MVEICSAVVEICSPLHSPFMGTWGDVFPSLLQLVWGHMSGSQWDVGESRGRHDVYYLQAWP